jgi:hypothetical protein
MKSQLTDCKQGRKINFGFASILCSFLFEQVPGLRPRVEIITRGPCDLAMSRWIEVMRQLGGDRVTTPYNDDFFIWWHQHVIAIDDYHYDGIDYRGDLYMYFPPGFAYGDIGMNFFYIFHFFVFFLKSKKLKIFLDGIKY